MNGGQDLGGLMGFGPVIQKPGEPVFREAWERRAFGLVCAMAATGTFTKDAFHHACEAMAPDEYLASSQYELWVKGLIQLLIHQGVVSIHELYGDQPIEPGAPHGAMVTAGDVPTRLLQAASYERPAETAALFQMGDVVLVRNDHPSGHTRVPRYVRGRRGTVAAVHGVFVLPDSNAHGKGETPQWCYSVRFAGEALWGRSADPSLAVMVDLWEPHLDPA
jgi:nitrile hydratase subunit beta